MSSEVASSGTSDKAKPSPWVSTAERMPSVGETGLSGWGGRFLGLVLTASSKGKVLTNRWNGSEWQYGGDVDWWMPIPPLPASSCLAEE